PSFPSRPWLLNPRANPSPSPRRACFSTASPYANLASPKTAASSPSSSPVNATSKSSPSTSLSFLLSFFPSFLLSFFFFPLCPLCSSLCDLCVTVPPNAGLGFRWSWVSLVLDFSLSSSPNLLGVRRLAAAFTVPTLAGKPSSRTKRPDFFFRAAFCRVGPRREESRFASLLFPRLSVNSVLSVSSVVKALLLWLAGSVLGACPDPVGA